MLIIYLKTSLNSVLYKLVTYLFMNVTTLTYTIKLLFIMAIKSSINF